MERRLGKYRYAKDSQGRLTFIVDVDKTQGRATYKCPSCSGDMLARQGAVNAWHFYIG